MNTNLFQSQQVAITSRSKNIGIVAKQFILLLTCFLVLFVSKAQNFTVNTIADGTSYSGTVNLRGAIVRADALGGTHIITVPAGTYSLTMGEIIFGNKAEDITISGAGAGFTTISMSATNQDRIFLINQPGTYTGITVSISGITFTNGRLKSDPYGGGAICGGGPTNNISITNCTFTNNTIDVSAATQYGGGAICFTYGGNLTVDQCSFSGNNIPSSVAQGGGAIEYYVYGALGVYPSSALSITNSTFTGNTAGSGSFGGAVYIQADVNGSGGTPTITGNVTKNTFTSNSAPGGSGAGGAISVLNGYLGKTFNINYNRFYTNTSGSGNGTALNLYNSYGNVNATNNWWGCNDGPAGCADKGYLNGPSNGGTYTTSPYLQLRTPPPIALCAGTSADITSGFTKNSAYNTINPVNLTAFANLTITFNNATLGTISPATATIQAATGQATTTYTAGSSGGTGYVYAKTDNVPNNDITSRDTITVNVAPTVTNPVSTAVCAGATATFSATGSGNGTLSYQWYKGSAALTNSGNYSGVTTNMLTISNTSASVAGTDYNVRISSTTGCGTATSANATLTVNDLPAITNQPASTTTCAGTSVSFTVTATGSGTLSYQWYKGTTALVNSSTGSMISGATTSTLTIGNPGTADAGTDYNVKVSSTTGCIPVTSANATLTVNAIPAFTAQPTVSPSSGICTGSTIILTASYTGIGSASFSNIQWLRGTLPLTGGPTGTGSYVSVISLSPSNSNITIENVSAPDSTNFYLKITSSAGCGSITSNPVLVNVRPPSLPTVNVSATRNVDPNNYVITDGSCNVIAAVRPTGTSQVSGNVTASVKIDPTIQTTPNGSPYVQRHYDIVPTNNAAAATATITLYFTQAELTAYNNAPNGGLNLPVNPADVENYRANIRIYQYHGTGTAPGNYTGSTVVIMPASSVYNGTYGRWEITFSVTGFSGFYLASSNSRILPLELTSFNGYTNGSQAMLQWKTTDERNASYFEIERSTDATNFMKVGQVNAGGNSYNFTDVPGAKTLYYYRLKIVDKDGRYTYSYTVAINLNKGTITLQVLPNPFTDKLMLNITAAQSATSEIRLMDMSGKILVKKTVTLLAGTNTVTLNQLSNLSKGSYLLQVKNEKMNETIKVLKVN